MATQDWIDSNGNLHLPFHQRFDKDTNPAPPWRQRVRLISALVPVVASTLWSYVWYGPKVEGWTLKYAVFASGAKAFLVAGRGPVSSMPSFHRGNAGKKAILASLPKDTEIVETTFRPSLAAVDFMKSHSPGEWPAEVAEDVSRELEAEWVTVKGALDSRVILHLHGGGYVHLSKVTHRGITASMSRYARAKVFAINYSLAPQAPYPCGLIDAISAYLHLLDLGYRPEHIVIMGDSAGGGLSLATAMALRDMGKPIPGGVYLQSPWLDLSHSFTGSLLDNEHIDYPTDQPKDPRKGG
ncbi:hypothetical protein HDU91_003947, partial [Kappamyces sp. JEL0680]